MDFIYSTINSEIIFKIDLSWNGLRFLEVIIIKLYKYSFNSLYCITWD